MDALASRSSNPRKLGLGFMVAGATSPICEAGGKTASAAAAGTAQARLASAVAAKIDREIMSLPRVGRSRAALRRPIHPAQCQVNAAAIGQQRGGAGNYPIHPMECQPGVSTEHQCVARGKPERPSRVATGGSAKAKQAGLAERQ